MLSIAEARAQIFQSAKPIAENRKLPLSQARKNILAADCFALVDAPPVDNSAMDGYAFQRPAHTPPWNFRISQTIQAGMAPLPLESGTAARILTGANIPLGADTVAIQEDCEKLGDAILIKEAIDLGANIRPRGQDFTVGQRLAQKGDVLDAAKLGLLAAGGHDQVLVVRAPRVILINTGNEIVEPGKPLLPGQIYNSNATLLRALLEGWGCTVERQMNLPDDLAQTQSALREAANADLIITSGGVSVGDEDHVKAAIESIGKIELWKINLKPGKPMAFGFIDNGTPIIGLPGNPVSSFVTAVLFVKAFIQGLYGRELDPLPTLYSPAAFTITGPHKRPELVRVRLTNNELTMYPNQSSGVLSSLAWADALALIEPESLPIKIGDSVPYFPLLALTEL